MHRKHIRLKGYDYRTPNYYFVTVCTKDRKEMFYPKVSEKYGEKLVMNVAAASYAAKNTDIIVKVIEDLEKKYYSNLEIDFYCTMRDHVHMIIAFHDKVTRMGVIGSRSYRLSDIIRAFKSITSRDAGFSIWQPNFYEHIIRNDLSLDRIRIYILNNPMVEYNDVPWKRIDP